jgi:hypothetical protein
LLSYFEGRFGDLELEVVQKGIFRELLWRYVHEREAWWKVVLDTKFGSAREQVVFF